MLGRRVPGNVRDQVLQGCATTTHGVRAALQRSKVPLQELAAKHGSNAKTLITWNKRAFGSGTQGAAVHCADAAEAAAVAFRCRALNPLDDCFYALQAAIPHLPPSSLHRPLQRHGIRRLPELDGEKPGKQAFEASLIGFSTLESQRSAPR